MKLQYLDLIAIIARYARQTYKQLNATDLLALNLIPRLCFRMQNHSNTNAMYATYFLKSIAAMVGRRPETVCRSTTKLQNLELITKRRRRWLRGKRQCNIYFVGKAIWRAISLFFQDLQGSRKLLDVIVKTSNETHNLRTRQQPKKDFSHKLKEPPDEEWFKTSEEEVSKLLQLRSIL